MYQVVVNKFYRKGLFFSQRSISCLCLCPVITHQMLLWVTQAHLAKTHSFGLYWPRMLVIITKHGWYQCGNELDLRKKYDYHIGFNWTTSFLWIQNHTCNTRDAFSNQFLIQTWIIFQTKDQLHLVLFAVSCVCDSFASVGLIICPSRVSLLNV